jgi:hypothetical protein
MDDRIKIAEISAEIAEISAEIWRLKYLKAVEEEREACAKVADKFNWIVGAEIRKRGTPNET